MDFVAEHTNMDRDLKFFELFCGSGKLTRAFRSHGYKSSQLYYCPRVVSLSNSSHIDTKGQNHVVQ